MGGTESLKCAGNFACPCGSEMRQHVEAAELLAAAVRQDMCVRKCLFTTYGFQGCDVYGRYRRMRLRSDGRRRCRLRIRISRRRTSSFHRLSQSPLASLHYRSSSNFSFHEATQDGSNVYGNLMLFNKSISSLKSSRLLH